MGYKTESQSILVCRWNEGYKRLLELIKDKLQNIKINTQKSIALEYTESVMAEKELVRLAPFTITTKYLNILCNINYPRVWKISTMKTTKHYKRKWNKTQL